MKSVGCYEKSMKVSATTEKMGLWLYSLWTCWSDMDSVALNKVSLVAPKGHNSTCGLRQGG